MIDMMVRELSYLEIFAVNKQRTTYNFQLYMMFKKSYDDKATVENEADPNRKMNNMNEFSCRFKD